MDLPISAKMAASVATLCSQRFCWQRRRQLKLMKKLEEMGELRERGVKVFRISFYENCKSFYERKVIWVPWKESVSRR